jgi:hypothetical protein
MFRADNPFFAQARLAVRVLRLVAEEPVLALKGGIAVVDLENVLEQFHP